MDETKEIRLENIYWPDETDITEEQIRNMAASIIIHGQIEDIVVCPAAPKYRGVIGRLRYEGMKNRWRAEPEGKTIQARIHKFKSEIEIKMWQLVENLHRRQVTAMQRARQYRDLYTLLRKEHGEEATIQTLVTAIEDITGNEESLKTVQHYLNLTKLEPKTQEILTGEKMSLRHGLELLRIKDPEKQVEAAETAQEDKLTVKELGYVVESVTVKERQDRQKKRLVKKAKELSDQGITVVLDTPYITWEQHEKAMKGCKRLFGDIPQKCEECPKRGVILRGNFKQDPMCTDLKCYETSSKEKREQFAKEQEAKEKRFEEERTKILEMKPDARTWRLTVYGMIDTWELANRLKVDRTDEEVWKALCKLDEKQCQTILIHKALSEILTGPTRWRGKFIKKWAVKEFNLTPEVFLAKE